MGETPQPQPLNPWIVFLVFLSLSRLSLLISIFRAHVSDLSTRNSSNYFQIFDSVKKTNKQQHTSKRKWTEKQNKTLCRLLFSHDFVCTPLSLSVSCHWIISAPTFFFCYLWPIAQFSSAEEIASNLGVCLWKNQGRKKRHPSTYLLHTF